uniref:adenine phosphoribosyltransferase isoform X2 n=1 Tax=Semicossyphus pulcher TaxID=241346 RepID=UPI0037E78FA7
MQWDSFWVRKGFVLTRIEIGKEKAHLVSNTNRTLRGASVATTLEKGFLAVRKAGHLCVATENQNYTDYTGREKTMEVRMDVLRPGMRVLLVDQWIETGGTMKAAIQLVEKFGATVVGVAAVAIENTEGGKWIKENYKFSHCIPDELQSQIDQKALDSFKKFKS